MYWFCIKFKIVLVTHYYWGEEMKVEMDDIESINETTLSIRGSRRRITVPKTIVERFQLKNGDKLRWVLLKDDTVLVSGVKA